LSVLSVSTVSSEETVETGVLVGFALTGLKAGVNEIAPRVQRDPELPTQFEHYDVALRYVFILFTSKFPVLSSANFRH